MSDQLISLIEALRREHDVADEDCWYACPKSGKNCGGYGGTPPLDLCTCGADAHNAKVDALLAVFSDPASIHLNILRGMIPLSRMNAPHIAGATDYDALKAERDSLLAEVSRLQVLINTATTFESPGYESDETAALRSRNWHRIHNPRKTDGRIV